MVADLDDTAAQLVAGAVQEAGGRAVAVAGDVTDPAFAERAVGEALRSFGGLHILVNNAGECVVGRAGGRVPGLRFARWQLLWSCRVGLELVLV